MRLPRPIRVLAVALVAAALVAPAAAYASAAPGMLDPVISRVFPLVTRFVRESAPDFAPGALMPSAGTSSGAVDVNVTFSIVSAGTPIPIFRFYSPKSGTHFYTPSAEERDMVIARWPNIWTYEGIAYWVNPARNSQPLFRFYNIKNGSHFYTASPSERDNVMARWSNIYQYDGPTYAVTPYPETGKVPVYRFYNIKNGSHFYTASPSERDNVIARWSNIYQLEGAAFWLGQ